MSVNDVVVMTPQKRLMIEIKFGERIDIEDWTQIFNIQPDMLTEFHGKKYGVKTEERITYSELMSMCTQ